MQTISLSASRRRDKVVILSSLAIEAKSQTFSLRSAANWANRTGRALFSAKASLAAAIIGTGAMLWLAATAQNAADAQDGIGTVGLCLMPWIAAWACRAYIAESRKAKKGGAL